MTSLICRMSRTSGPRSRRSSRTRWPPSRMAMKQILPDIWQWSWFSPEKQIDFNGLLLTVGEHRVLVDPPPMSDDDKAQVRSTGQLDYIVITNRDHDRQAATYRQEFRCQVLVPEIDAPQMELKADKTYKDGELL